MESWVRGVEIAWVLAVGAAVGSFLNVVIARVPQGLSIVRPASRCPRCETPIGWRDNVPILSWLLLRARCRTCKTYISARYPFVEALGAAAAYLAWQRHGLTGAAAAELAFAALLVALAFIDLDTWLLPLPLTVPLLASGVSLGLAGAAPAPTPESSLLGAALGGGGFVALSWLAGRILRKEALGLGDAWLLAGIGAWLGAGALVPVVFLSSLQGSVLGVLLILLRRRRTPAPAPPPAGDGWVPHERHVPYGPFLAAAALQWLFAGDAIARTLPMLEVFR